ncbi:E3 ubiquitin-protein ligase CCNB1IP1 [Holothuria leucospilota]|uniref:E3 ubiquitin-protein ligase CCNB1IP1 n=1 Tax=Holothuria leucospilota TaxID=206669 RepID=A0A9Q1BLZ9_HOLLE|nr:E3 ubiquitin-protein ligase CCNB1IP1 [Holothuria leucospilota]
MAEELICNYKKCRKRLGSFGWVTSCSRNTNLPGKFDLIRIDLCPSEQHKSMVLAGQKPEVIMEACSRAMAFWSYQIHQERVYQEYTATKAKQRGTQLEQYYEQLLSRAQSEVSCILNLELCDILIFT